MIVVQELTKQMKVVQLSRMKERGSSIDTTNESDSNFDILKETATGFNTTIYENSTYLNVMTDENSAESNGTTVVNNTVTNVTTNEDENNTDIKNNGDIEESIFEEEAETKMNVLILIKTVYLWDK